MNIEVVEHWMRDNSANRIVHNPIDDLLSRPEVQDYENCSYAQAFGAKGLMISLALNGRDIILYFAVRSMVA